MAETYHVYQFFLRYCIRPNYHTVRLDFSKLLHKLVAKYQPNKGTC